MRWSCRKRSPSIARPPKAPKNFYHIKDELISRGYEVKANDTICRQVSNRDKDLPAFAVKFDKIVLFRGVNLPTARCCSRFAASITRILILFPRLMNYRLACSHPAIRWGIAGATSTPLWLMELVKAELEKF